MPQTTHSIDDPQLEAALNELGRSINLATTYGNQHPAAQSATEKTMIALAQLFTTRKRVVIGAFNGCMTIDGLMVNPSGALLKSLERRLVRLNITGLRLNQGISTAELLKLTELLALNTSDAFQKELSTSNMDHITPEKTRYQAITEGQTVANESDLNEHINEDGILVLDEEQELQQPVNHLHVDQIIAFLKGNIEADSASVGEELTKAANDPERLANLIMESVAIRQATADISGETLNDIIVGCLRRTYTGLRKQPSFQTKEGKTELKKALLMLEESLLERMRDLAGADNPELDRQIVQAIREIDESLNFEIAANEYIEHREAIKQTREALCDYIRAQGAKTAGDLLQDTSFPNGDWRKIVIESNQVPPGMTSSLTDGLSTLTTVFKQLEQLIKSQALNGDQMKNLMGQATLNLDGNLDDAKGSLEKLSSTIGGHGSTMSRDDLLAALSEIAQELMQPLTAINASVEMMMLGYVGNISDEQEDLLLLASRSGEHLEFLMDMLIEIVGCPKNKGVDNRFHTTSDEVQSRKRT